MIKKNSTSKDGFTLIELLISVTIIVLMSGTALTAFLDYQKRRQVQEEATNVADRLRTIQIKATAVEIPVTCTTVTNYVASLSGSDLSVSATCPGVGSVVLPTLSLTLTDSIFSNGPLAITFDSRTVSASPVTINICGNNILYRVDVNQTANVGRPVYVGGC